MFIWNWLKRVVSESSKTPEEVYLSSAHNLADLEFRMKMVNSGLAPYQASFRNMYPLRNWF